MSNHHARLKQLEKLAAIAKSKAKAKADSAEQDKLSKSFAALSTEELNDRYQAVQAELAAQPIDSEIVNLTTEQIISKYAQLCKES